MGGEGSEEGHGIASDDPKSWMGREDEVGMFSLDQRPSAQVLSGDETFLNTGGVEGSDEGRRRGHGGGRKRTEKEKEGVGSRSTRRQAPFFSFGSQRPHLLSYFLSSTSHRITHRVTWRSQVSSQDIFDGLADSYSWNQAVTTFSLARSPSFLRSPTFALFFRHPKASPLLRTSTDPTCTRAGHLSFPAAKHPPV